MSLPASALAGVKFDNTLGAVLVGGFFSTFLYGLTCLQTFIYFQRYSRDRPFFKLLVATLWSIDTLDAVLTSHVCYWYLVSNFANPLAIFSPVWSIKLHVIVTCISNFIVRCMFATRVYKFSHGSFLITGGIVAISIVDLVVGAIITVKAFSITSFIGLESVTSLFYLNFASNISADSYVAAFLSYYLWKSRTGFGRTDSLINKLIIYTVNTGILTALDASAGLITYAVMPNNLVFIGFYLNLSKFYVNSYLASLNARDGLATKMKSDGMVSIHLSKVSDAMPNFRRTGSRSTSANNLSNVDMELGTNTTSTGLEIKVETSVDSHADELTYQGYSSSKQTLQADSFVGKGYAI